MEGGVVKTRERLKRWEGSGTKRGGRGCENEGRD